MQNESKVQLLKCSVSHDHYVWSDITTALLRLPSCTGDIGALIIECPSVQILGIASIHIQGPVVAKQALEAQHL